MKKIKYFVLILCFTFLVGCSNKKENQEPIATTTPLLLEVSSPDQENKLYLFGSIHAADESLYPLPDYVVNAYNQSDALAVEFDIIAYTENLTNQLQLLAKFMYKDKDSIKNHISTETYESGVAILKEAGLYHTIMDQYYPIMWQSLIENSVLTDSGLEESYGIDKHFLTLAKENSKEIIELESAESQYEMLLGFSLETQVYLLEESIKAYDTLKENMRQLYMLYKEGNPNHLEQLLAAEETNAYVEEYNEQLVTIRNQNMTASLENYFKEGKNIFCTVGLAHIIGEGGIADLLEQKGYSVKQIQSLKQ